MVHFSDFFSRFSSYVFKEIFHQFNLIEAIEPPSLEKKAADLNIYIFSLASTSCNRSRQIIQVAGKYLPPTTT